MSHLIRRVTDIHAPADTVLASRAVAQVAVHHGCMMSAEMPMSAKMWMSAEMPMSAKMLMSAEMSVSTYIVTA